MFTFLAKNCIMSTKIEIFSNALPTFEILFEPLSVISEFLSWSNINYKAALRILIYENNKQVYNLNNRNYKIIKVFN